MEEVNLKILADADHHDEEMTIILDKLVADKIADIYARREEIVEAFIAKYGCQPDELVMVEQSTPNGVAWYITTKAEMGARR